MRLVEVPRHARAYPVRRDGIDATRLHAVDGGHRAARCGKGTVCPHAGGVERQVSGAVRSRLVRASGLADVQPHVPSVAKEVRWDGARVGSGRGLGARRGRDSVEKLRYAERQHERRRQECAEAARNRGGEEGREGQVEGSAQGGQGPQSRPAGQRRVLSSDEAEPSGVARDDLITDVSLYQLCADHASWPQLRCGGHQRVLSDIEVDLSGRHLWICCVAKQCWETLSNHL